MNFLIVDDMDNMRRSIRAMLKLIQFGKEHFEAANGLDAWRLINDEIFHLDFIIADWHMPRMNGIELLCKVRSDKRFRDIPFLIITAESNQTVIAEAAEYDVDAYLTKPFVTATLEQKINEILTTLKNPPPLKILLKKARELRENGDINGAIACATKAAGINKRSSRPLRELGQLFLKKGDLQRSMACFEKATKLNRLDVPSYHYLGEIYFKKGDMEKAIANYSMAVQLSPRHTKRAFKFAKLLLEKQKFQEAEKIFKIVIKNNVNDADLLEEIADACFEQDVCDLAVKTYKNVLTKDPERWYLHKKIAFALQKAKRGNEAIAAFEESLQRTPDDTELLLALAQTYLDIKMPIRADKWATKVIRIDRENKEAKKILDQCL